MCAGVRVCVCACLGVPQCVVFANVSFKTRVLNVKNERKGNCKYNLRFFMVGSCKK